MYRIYLRLLLLLKAHRFLAVALVLILALLCAFILSHKDFDNDIATMLPEGSEAQKTLRFINKSSLSNKIIISLHLKDSAHSLEQLQQQIELLSAKLHSPLISKVDYKLSPSSPFDDLQKLTFCLPQILGKDSIGKLEKMLDPRESAKIVDNIYQQLASPAGMIRSSFIQSDPLALKIPVLKKLQNFRDIWGFKIAPGHNYFISCDRRSAMLILQTTVSGTNTVQSKKLIHTIRKVLNALPPWVTADIIASHLRSLSNESIIKKDIRLTLILSFVGFLLLFAFFYKYDFRCLFIVALPVLATVFVLTAMTLVFDRTLLFVIGLGGVVVGIAVDYGIHIYSAMASGRYFRGTASIIRPLAAGGLTTFGVFAIFMFADTPGYRQLGVFAGCSIMLSLGLSVLFLPILFVNKKIPQFSTRRLYEATEKIKKYPLLIVICYTVFIILSVYVFSQVRFADDLKLLDGSHANIAAAEARFQETWQSNKRPAILAVSAKNPEAAAVLAQKQCCTLRKNTGARFFCATDIWPSAATREKNLARFAQFLATGKLQKLQGQLEAQAQKRGFAKGLFTPFFTALRRGIEQPDAEKLPMMFRNIISQTTNLKAPNHAFFIFFPDKPELVKQVRTLVSGKNNCFVISRNSFRQMLSEAVIKRILKLLCAALITVCVITVLLMRRVLLAALALLPVLSAIIVSGAFFVLFAIPVNAAACIGAIVVAGLAIDYGIFMATELSGRRRSNVLGAITLSSLTTLIGAGAVIFAIHPMLRSVGVVLCVGIFTAWITAVIVIPGIWQLFKRAGVPKILQLFIVVAVLAGAGCSSVNPFEHPELPPLPDKSTAELLEEFDRRHSENFSALSGVVFNWRSRKQATLCAVELDCKARHVAVLGMNLMGIRLFEAAGSARNPKLLFCALNLKLKHPEKFAGLMIKDIGNIYFDQLPAKPCSVIRNRKQVVISSPRGKSQLFKHYFGGSPLVLLKKQLFSNNILQWEVNYYKYKKSGQLLIPYAIFYRNNKYDYYLEIRLKELTVKDQS